MMIYIYAILLTADQPSQLMTGLSDQPLQCFAVDDLTAIAEAGVNISALRELAEPDLLLKVLRHDQIVSDLFGDRPLLPMRFGMAFVSESALSHYLQEHHQQLSDQLHFLQDKAEYTLELTAEIAISKSIEPKDGKNYLLGKKQQYIQQQVWSDRLINEQQDWQNYLGQYCDRHQIPYQSAPTSSNAWKCYLLLSQKQYGAFTTYLEQVRQNMPHWLWQISLPLPPYHFV